ncbi:MAG: ribosome biogenesis GTPase Der [Planctomycetota bacterium]|jgi:GTP-binding protein|nr:ribosome biogenesis GTPase Der [Planctomycetota bacterium]
MPYDSVALVGRPNVGKSTLFNALAGSRIAIEADSPGATRDRVLFPISLEGRTFDLVDTGGIGVSDSQRLERLVERQIALAIEAANPLLFLVDGRDGIVPYDYEVAAILRRSGKKVVLAATKIDTQRLEDGLPDYRPLGFGAALPVSAKQNRGLHDLKRAILAALPPEDPGKSGPGEGGELPRIALVGRRNVGKSTLVNRICRAERVIVSEVPGTTRDSLDITVRNGGEAFILIDTAGLRKRGQMDDSLEFFGQMRTERAIRRADAAILMLDATDEIGKVDKRVSALILARHKPCLIALNKWDLVRQSNPGLTPGDFSRYLGDRLPGMHFCRLAALSAREGENADEVVASTLELIRQGAGRTGTAALNAALAEAQKKRAARPKGGKPGRIYYGTQVGVSPPTFLLFVNNPAQFDEGYLRYLGNQLRRKLAYPEIPLRILLEASSEKEIGRYGPPANRQPK